MKLPRIFLSTLFVLSVLIASEAVADLSNAIIYDLPLGQELRMPDRLPGSALSREDSLEIMSYRYDGDTVRVLTILVDWTDRPHTYPRTVFDSLMFSRNVFAGGSVADYYDEVSYGQLTVTGNVLNWYSAGQYMFFDWFDFEDILFAIDGLIDYSQYDANNDGFVDAITFVRSGNGEEDSQDPNDIWSFAVGYGGSGLGPFDGVYVNRWNTSPETRPLRNPSNPTIFLGVDTLNRIRVFVHELGHNLGLPDLYDYDSKLVTFTYTNPGDANDHPLVDWCVMGYYGYGYLAIGSEIPSHFCGWSKKEMGFIQPINLTGEHIDLVIYDIETHADSSLYKVPIDVYGSEYFLLEYRNPQSTGMFDKLDSDFSVFFWPDLTYGCDPLDRGLLITHIDDALPSNDGTPDFPHYRVIVEDAGYNPSMDETANPEGHVTDSAQWWYPNETRKGALFSDDVTGQDLFSPTTYPSSDGYSGPSGITVRVDSIVGNRLYAYVNNPNDFDSDDDGVPDSIDNCVDMPNPDQVDVDGDGNGDVCDNCVMVFNPDQEDLDADFVGDSCDNCYAVANPDQEDMDADSRGDSCDNCPGVFNVQQEDADLDGVGDSCDFCTDIDGDGYGNGYVYDTCALDNCPDTANPKQEDADTNGVGDACCCNTRCNVDNLVGPGVECDVADLSYLVDYLFRGGPIPPCPEQANVDNVIGVAGPIDIADLSYMVEYLFRGGPPPPPCP